MKTKLIHSLMVLALLAGVFQARAQGTAFTYSGKLNNGSNPANGSYDLTFSLFSLNSGGSALAGPLTNSATGVTNGLFTVTLDFGNVFDGANRWLEIGVRTNGTGAFTTLAPRQQLTPTPYAIFANTASNLSGVLPASQLNGKVSLAQLPSAVVTNNNTTALNLTGTFAGNGAGLTNLPASGGAASNAWSLGGNNVTPGKFLGSLNNQPVEIWVNNRRVVQLAYASNSASGYSPNVVFGNSVNIVNNGVVGATIVGGGVAHGFYQPSTNQVSADFGTVVGGYGNTASGKYSVAMGFRAVASGSQSTALGGAGASGDYSTAAGNSGASGKFSTAMGSSGASLVNDTAMGTSTANGGGSTAMGTSQASGLSSTAMGFSTASGDYSTAVGQSTATNLNATAMGASTAGGMNSTAVGQSTATNLNATAMGASTAGGMNSTAMGQSTASGDYSTAMGIGCIASGPASIAGGAYNTSAANFATVAGGEENNIPVGSDTSVIGGGYKNVVRWGVCTTIAGGYENITGDNPTFVGDYASVGGGYENNAEGEYATVPGGFSNWAIGDNSLAAGNRAKALSAGDFVWADSQQADYFSTASDQFCIRAHGGIMLDNSTPAINFGNQTRQMLNLWNADFGIGVQNNTEYFRSGGVYAWFRGGVHADGQADPGAGGVLNLYLDQNGNLGVTGYVNATAYNTISDRNLKAGFEPVDTKTVLEKVASMSISRWHFTNDVTTTHLGPMAQDFYAAFNVGMDDKHIATVDEEGVALAAIQGLNQKLDETQVAMVAKDAEIQTLKQQNNLLAERLNELEASVKQLAGQRAYDHQ